MGEETNTPRWLKKAGDLSAALSEAGFSSVFEHMRPNGYGRNTVYTLWVQMGNGLEVLTIVDGNGAASVHRLTAISPAEFVERAKAQPST